MATTTPTAEAEVSTTISFIRVKIDAGFKIILLIGDDKVSREGELLRSRHNAGHLCGGCLDVINGATGHFELLTAWLGKLKAAHCFVELASVFPVAAVFESAVWRADCIEVRNRRVMAGLLSVNGRSGVTHVY